jgi:hypothetical protein
VLLRHGPEALRIVDLGHEIGAQHVREAAFFLRCAVPRFAPGTIHLAIVDPGVGSARRGLVAEAHGQYLVGPDNGLLVPALDALGGCVEAVELNTPSFWRPQRSNTFHGRDLFGPVAGHLAAGVQLLELGTQFILARDKLAMLEEAKKAA